MISLLGFLVYSRKYKHSTPFFGFTKFYKVMIWSVPITCDEINKRMTLHDLAQGSGGTWLGGGTIVTAGTHQPVPSEQNTISKYKPTK